MRVIAFALLFSLVLLPAAVQGAVIEGNVYDLFLDKVPGAIVEIDTSPRQQIVAETGSYSLEAGPGEYLVKARRLDKGMLVSSAEERIEVAGEGNYRLDLIVFPSFEEEESIMSETEALDVGGLEFPDGADYSLYILIGVVAVVLVLLAVLVKVNRLKPVKEPSLPRELEKAVRLIRREGGRTTQKELRKGLGLSEAKVSLLVADLEARGVLRKIKKGRGNILALK